MRPNHTKRVAIAGAGNVGRSIANELLDHGHQVLLIERAPRAMKLDTVGRAEWLHADACELSTLEGAELQNFDVVVAAEQAAREGRSDPAAAQDDDVHGAPNPRARDASRPAGLPGGAPFGGPSTDRGTA